MIRRELFSKQFLLFLFAGSLAACVNFSVGYSLAGLFPYHADIVFGHLSGMVVAFFLFEKNVFGRSRESRVAEISIFIVVNIFSIIQTWVVYVLLHVYALPALEWHFYPQELSRAIAIAVPVCTSFFGHKYLTFRQ